MKPLLIAVAGKAGTGKTTFARALSKELRFPYFDYDTLVQPFLQTIEKRCGLGHEGRNHFYQNWRSASYETLWNIAAENIELGFDIIMSAPLSKEVRDSFFPEKLRKRIKRDFALLLCYMAPPADLHYKMVLKRSCERDEQAIQNKVLFNEQYSAEKPLWDENCVLYFDTGDLNGNIQRALKKVYRYDYKRADAVLNRHEYDSAFL